MRDFCSKNGCLEAIKDCGTEQEILQVFLNSVVSFDEDEQGQVTRSYPDCRCVPDVTFYVDSNGYVDGMNVDSLNSYGANEFLAALLKSPTGISTREELLNAIQSLLSQDGAVWGIVHDDEIWEG